MRSFGNQLGQQTAILTDQITETSNELSMTHDYMTGLHYSLVEHGGFLRNGLGLSHDQWIHLTTLERANMISSRTMGSVEFMRLVRQRMVPAETADQTDEATEDGTEMEVEPTTTSRLGDREQSLEEMLNFIKAEHQGCIDRQECWDANNLQNLILELLEGVRNQVPTNSMYGRCRARIVEVFSDLADRAVDQHRWESADHYTAISNTYGDG